MARQDAAPSSPHKAEKASFYLWLFCSFPSSHSRFLKSILVFSYQRTKVALAGVRKGTYDTHIITNLFPTRPESKKKAPRHGVVRTRMRSNPFILSGFPPVYVLQLCINLDHLWSIRIAILIQCFCAFAPRGTGGVHGRIYGVQMNIASSQTGIFLFNPL